VELYLDLMGHDINNMNQIAIGFLEIALNKLREASGSTYRRGTITRPVRGPGNQFGAHQQCSGNFRKSDQESCGEDHRPEPSLSRDLR